MLCSTKCQSSASLSNHFITKHDKAVTASQRAVMVKAGEQAVTRFDGVACLMCDKWRPPKGGEKKNSSRKFQSHMEKHMQELAREALPLAIDGLEIRDAQSDDDNDDIETTSSASHDDIGLTPQVCMQDAGGKFVPVRSFVDNIDPWLPNMISKKMLDQLGFGRNQNNPLGLEIPIDNITLLWSVQFGQDAPTLCQSSFGISAHILGGHDIYFSVESKVPLNDQTQLMKAVVDKSDRGVC